VRAPPHRARRALTPHRHFGDAHTRWTNVAYSIHDYALFGFPRAPELYAGTEEQRHILRRNYEKKREWMDVRGLCVWNGEFGPVYARRQFEGERTDEINEARYHVLKDQLALYNKVGSCQQRFFKRYR
jgi:hypothetical protein